MTDDSEKPIRRKQLIPYGGTRPPRGPGYGGPAKGATLHPPMTAAQRGARPHRTAEQIAIELERQRNVSLDLLVDVVTPAAYNEDNPIQGRLDAAMKQVQMSEILDRRFAAKAAGTPPSLTITFVSKPGDLD